MKFEFKERKIPKRQITKEINKVSLLSKCLPLFLLPEKYQITLLNNIPPSNVLNGIKLNKPRKRFNMATLDKILIIISSLEFAE